MRGNFSLKHFLSTDPARTSTYLYGPARAMQQQQHIKCEPDNRESPCSVFFASFLCSTTRSRITANISLLFFNVFVLHLVMHLGYYVCGVLAVGVGVFSSSVDTALLVPHVRATLLPVATSSPRPANFSGPTYINGSHVNEKYGGSYPYQQIINPCPEKIGWPILLCSACGGESPQFPGHCHGNTIGTPRFCKCTYLH